MARNNKIIKTHSPRPPKGRGVFLHRDSGGEHETTACQYVEWAAGFCFHNGVTFTGTKAKMLDLIGRSGGVDGDIFLDWNVSGNIIERDALQALLAEVARDRTISHVLIARPDRLVRPDEIEKGIILERTLRQKHGVHLVFQTRTCAPIPIGESMPIWEFVQAAMDYAQAGGFRRELASKMLYSQRELATAGFSSGGRAGYGLQRFLIAADGRVDRPLRDGETVRGNGFHVAILPREDETFAIRMRIKRELLTTAASELAKKLTLEGIPSPDSNRTRRDNGVEHQTLGVWHASTIKNIGEDLIDSGVVAQGKRSMGDQFRHSAKGPRPLVESDFREGNLPKVIRNSEDQWTRGKAHFDSTFSPEDQAALSLALQRRGGTQRGKPRSKDPDRNPLGGRVFDMNCNWLMYRSPYLDSYRYTCGSYMQSHGAACSHNHVDGPTLVQFVLSVLREKVLSPERLAKLKAKLTELAESELRDNSHEKVAAAKKTELHKLQRDIERAGDNLARAESDDERKIIRLSLARWLASEKQLEAELREVTATTQIGTDVKTEVAKAMNGLSTLTDLANSANGAARQIIAGANAKVFLQFGEEKWGKRTVRKPVGGVVTIGSQPPPIEIYAGSTDRRSIKKAKKEAAALEAAAEEGLKPSELAVSLVPHQEGASLGKPHRGDRI